MKRIGAAIAIVAFLLAGVFVGRADATVVRPEVAVVAAEDCTQTATVTIWNAAWRVGLTEDATIVESDHPDLIPVDTHISIETPFTVTFALTQDMVIRVVVQFPHEPDKLTPYLIPVDFSESCVPPTTEPPTTSTTAEPVAPPAEPVATSPVVTG